MADKLLITTSEACELLSVGRTFLYEQLIRPGRLPVVRLGRSVRVPAGAVAQLVDELAAAAAEDRA